jgi:hypothetical protein
MKLKGGGGGERERERLSTVSGYAFLKQVGAGNFSLHHRVQSGSEAHPASYPMGTRGSFPGGKRPEREAPSGAEVKE